MPQPPTKAQLLPRRLITLRLPLKTPRKRQLVLRKILTPRRILTLRRIPILRRLQPKLQRLLGQISLLQIRLMIFLMLETQRPRQTSLGLKRLMQVLLTRKLLHPNRLLKPLVLRTPAFMLA